VEAATAEGVQAGRNNEVNTSLHDFHNGFIPEADLKDDHIIVTRNSPLISAVSRKRPGEYRIWVDRLSAEAGVVRRRQTR
jgi:hypothetical protein